MLPAGCASLDRSVALAEQVVTPIAVGDASDVSAYDLAEAMLRAGFTRQQILKDGPAIHNALAKSGGAQVRYGKVAESDELQVEAPTSPTTPVARGKAILPTVARR